MTSVSKAELYDLIDALPESEAPVAKKFLEFLLSQSGDPVVRALLKASMDDEPLDEADLKELEEADKAIAEGRVKPWEEVKKELGL
jgi:hypothetical protein